MYTKRLQLKIHRFLVIKAVFANIFITDSRMDDNTTCNWSLQGKWFNKHHWAHPIIQFITCRSFWKFFLHANVNSNFWSHSQYFRNWKKNQEDETFSNASSKRFKTFLKLVDMPTYRPIGVLWVLDFLSRMKVYFS